MAWLTEAEFLYLCDTGNVRVVQKPEPVRSTSRRREPRPFDGLTFEVPDFTAGINASLRRFATEPQRQVQQAAERLARIGRFQLGGHSRPAKRSDRRAGAASR